MTTPLLQSSLHGLMGGARLLGLEGDVTRRVDHGAPCLSDSRLYLLRQAPRNQLYSYVLEGGKSVHHFPRFRPHIFLWVERCS